MTANEEAFLRELRRVMREYEVRLTSDWDDQLEETVFRFWGRDIDLDINESLEEELRPR